MTFRKSRHEKPGMLLKMKCQEFHQHFENWGDYFWIRRSGGNFNNRETPERIETLGPYAQPGRFLY